MNVSFMSTQILQWEFDYDISAWTSAITRTGSGQNRFVDLVVSEAENGAYWEAFIDATGEAEHGAAASLQGAMRAAIISGLRFLVHSVCDRAA